MALGVQRHPETVLSAPGLRGRAFTMVDVLVTMAVIAVLLSLLMPTLSSVRETARQVVCRSNTRQVGIGLTTFAGDHEDRLPHSVFIEQANTPWETVQLRKLPESGWDGLGLLYSEEYTPAPLVFYCPSHRGDHRYLNYEDAWGGDVGLIVGNFQYRGRAPVPHGPPTDRLSVMSPNTTLIADGFRSQIDFNHQIGANRFRADISVGWFSDRGGSVVAQLPKDGVSAPPSNYTEGIWEELDK
jgi:hypothetical protein